ncbi:MAG: C-terminal binding protein [Bryobacterales bacterium]|nr:C-terminal binding protein [Bryobacterales bacterium]
MREAIVCMLESKESRFATDTILEQEALGDVANVHLLVFDGRDVDRTDILTRADALIVSHHPRISGSVIETLPQIQAIVRNGAGFDNVDLEAARLAGIAVCNVPDYGTEEVADHTLLLTLALERRLKAGMQDVSSDGWNWAASTPARRLRGQVFGIVGCGRIGTAAAMRARAFGFRVVFFDPYVAAGYEKALGIERAGSLEELLPKADVVSFHAPLNRETRGILNPATIGLLRRGALVVNTARGGIVNEAAALDALRDGQLGGLALDVVEREPAFDRELLSHLNCIVTPHMAFYSEEAIRDMRQGAASIIRQVLTTGIAANVVNGVNRTPAAQKA